MKDTPTRTNRITTRFRDTDKDMIVLAARREGITLSELVRVAVVSSAVRILTPRPGPSS